MNEKQLDELFSEITLNTNSRVRKKCGKRFDDLTGTIFMERHQLLSIRFTYLYLMGLNVSNRQISEELGLDDGEFVARRHRQTPSRDADYYDRECATEHHSAIYRRNYRTCTVVNTDEYVI